MAIKEKIIIILKNFILEYDSKNNLLDKSKPIYLCDRFDTRNRYKNHKYKIPENLPQCPIYKDNRCCGGCKHASYCDHCVDCGCFGYTYAQRGGTDEKTYMRKCTDYYECGRVKNGKFDWDYYKLKTCIKNFKKGRFFKMYNNSELKIFKIVSNIDKNHKCKVLDIQDNYYKNIVLDNPYMKTYENKECI